MTDDTIITPDGQAKHEPPRRDFLRGFVATTVAAAAATVGAASGDDSALVRAAHEAIEASERSCGLTSKYVPSHCPAAIAAEADALLERHDDLVATIIQTPAGTHDGLRAKASLLRYLMPRDFQGDRLLCPEDCDDWERLAWSLCQDMMGAPA